MSAKPVHFRPGPSLNADDLCLLITEHSAPYAAVQIANEHDLIVRDLVSQIDDLNAHRAAATERERAMREALNAYVDTYCEGFCSDWPDGVYDFEQCGGCKARAALTAKAGDAG